jgi:hypothetical protein
MKNETDKVWDIIEDDREKYQKIIKEFEEGINRAHFAKVKNVRVGEKLVTVDLCLISHPGYYKMPDSIYKNCKYIKEELENGYIFDRAYKNRNDEF